MADFFFCLPENYYRILSLSPPRGSFPPPLPEVDFWQNIGQEDRKYTAFWFDIQIQEIPEDAVIF